MPGIEILLNFVPNPRKISPFSKKKSFLSKTYLASWQLKNLTKRLKTVFFGVSLVFKGLNSVRNVLAVIVHYISCNLLCNRCFGHCLNILISRVAVR